MEKGININFDSRNNLNGGRKNNFAEWDWS